MHEPGFAEEEKECSLGSVIYLTLDSQKVFFIIIIYLFLKKEDKPHIWGRHTL